MGALTVRLADSLHEKVRDLAEEEGISMNQLVMLAVSEKITRLDAEAQFAHLDALERFGKVVADEDIGPDEMMEDLLDRAGDKGPQKGDRRPTRCPHTPCTVGIGSCPRVQSFSPHQLRRTLHTRLADVRYTSGKTAS